MSTRTLDEIGDELRSVYRKQEELARRQKELGEEHAEAAQALVPVPIQEAMTWFRNSFLVTFIGSNALAIWYFLILLPLLADGYMRYVVLLATAMTLTGNVFLVLSYTFLRTRLGQDAELANKKKT